MKCGDCKWWKLPPNEWNRNGECRRMSPFPRNIIISTERGNRDDSEGAWPSTEKEDWCGQFEPKPVMFSAPPPFVSASVPEAVGGQG